MRYYGILLLGLLASCTTTKPVITSPGMDYQQDGVQTTLDVADIQILDAYTAPSDAKKSLLPHSVVRAIQDWAQARFVASGSAGTAVIKIVNAAVNQENLIAPKDVHMLLNPDSKNMEYGVNVAIEIQVQDTPVYTTGTVKTSLSRHVTMDSDVVLGFNDDVWKAFMDNLINALDRKVQLDIQTYLPKLLTSSTATQVSF